jgi:hexulose-6-phosphate isomerase
MGNSTSNNIDPKEEILMMKNYIINVHIKDRKSNFGPTVPLGKGDTNFNNIFSLLYNIKYNGDYIIQAARKDILHPYTSNHIDTVKDYISFIQNFCK